MVSRKHRIEGGMIADGRGDVLGAADEGWDIERVGHAAFDRVDESVEYVVDAPRKPPDSSIARASWLVPTAQTRPCPRCGSLQMGQVGVWLQSPQMPQRRTLVRDGDQGRAE